MKILVTGSAGHLGEALLRTFENSRHEAVGIDINASPYTRHVGSIVDRELVQRCMDGVDAVIHTATLHKPHIATHSRQDFVDTNITGTLNLLESAAAVGVTRFVYTSTTSTFGRALAPPPGAPAAWITEDVMPVPKNIYGATKLGAEHLCEMFQHRSGMPCIVLRTSRFFPEEDDDEAKREAFDSDNLKVNELLYRRADIEDVVSAHLLALERAPTLKFGRYIISATSPFSREDLPALRGDAAAVVRRYVPEYERVYSQRGWSLMHAIDRVYVNDLARQQLGWAPRYDFAHVVRLLSAGEDYRSPLARAVGAKGYHSQEFAVGPYPTE
jgi:UDP-glucose 4-epimerase